MNPERWHKRLDLYKYRPSDPTCGGRFYECSTRWAESCRTI